jgi:hypothetical protein
VAELVEAAGVYLDVLDNAPDESSTSELRTALANFKGSRDEQAGRCQTAAGTEGDPVRGD